jgi:uncharacterized protein (TIGR02600 family)
MSATLDINIPRNIKLLTYLDYLTQTGIPGYGVAGSPALFGSATGKYGLWGMHQILTEIFDYIRITDLVDSHFVTYTGGPLGNGYRVNGSAPYPYASPWEQPYGYGQGQGQVVPSYFPNWRPSPLGSSPGLAPTTASTNATTGVGTLPVPTEVTIHFVALGDTNNPIYPQEWKGGFIPPGPDTVDALGHQIGADYGILGLASIPYDDVNITTQADGSGKVASGKTAIQAFVYVTWTFPAAWHSGQWPALNYDITGLNKVDITTAGKSTSFSVGVGSPPTPTHISPATCLQFTAADHLRMDWAASQGGMGLAQSMGYYPAYANTGSECSNRILGPTSGGTTINGNGGPWPPGSYSDTYVFPFYSSVFTVPTAATGLVLTDPNPITISIYNGATFGNASPNATAANGNLYAKYTFTFPAATLKVPTVTGTSFRIIGTQSIREGDNAYYSAAQGNYAPSPSTDERWWYAQTESGQSIFIDSGDTAKSIVLSQTWQEARMMLSASAQYATPTAAFTGHLQYATTAQGLSHTMICPTYGGMTFIQGGTPLTMIPGVLPSAGTYSEPPFTTPWTTRSVAPAAIGSVAAGKIGSFTNTGAPGDWDNGVGSWPDGPWINKADEGSLPDSGGYLGYIPYYTTGNGTETNYQALFSPNKEIPSPGMFGSLPTGVPNINNLAAFPAGFPPAPWQTLLFRPGSGFLTALGGKHHPGEAGYGRDGLIRAGAPPDHALMDLFWMPVGEPYAISEPFSTAGKINLNYQILPFTYIARSTALRAALASELVAKCAASDSVNYKHATGLGYNPGISTTKTFRLPINLDATTSQFDTKFTAWDLFRSASQICEIFIVPKGYTYGTTTSDFPSQWYDLSSSGDFALVGDNVRERPYVDMYQKVTTKSNTYTVYYRVQALKSPPSVDPAKWNESQGAITGEYRGSTTLERFIDVKEGTTTAGVFTSSIPDAVAQVDVGTVPTSLEKYYKWRVVENHQFAP